jgi:hypothetical protein
MRAILYMNKTEIENALCEWFILKRREGSEPRADDIVPTTATVKLEGNGPDKIIVAEIFLNPQTVVQAPSNGPYR